MGARIRTYRLYRTDDLAICIECPEESENHGRPDCEDPAEKGCGSFCRSIRARWRRELRVIEETSERLSGNCICRILIEARTLGATVTALRGRVFAMTKALPRKAVTVAP